MIDYECFNKLCYILYFLLYITIKITRVTFLYFGHIILNYL